MNQGLIAWFAHNPVAANLLMFLIIFSGILVIPSLEEEVFPDSSANEVAISVVYPGASPEEVEEAICIRIEEQVHNLTGIRQVRSTAVEGAGTVVVEVLPEEDLQRVLDDIKSRVDAIDSFPIDAEEPIIQESVVRPQVISVAVSGEVDELTLKRLGERVRDELTAIPGITLVDLINTRPYEISIEVSERALERHRISFDAVAEAVRRTSLDLPAGSIKERAGEVLLRTKGQAYSGPDFADLTLITRADGSRVRLGDVAAVRDGFAEVDQATRFDGRPAALVEVFRVGNQSALDISRKVHEYVREAHARMPPGITLTTWRDDAALLKGRLKLLLDNFGLGFALLFIPLALFLRLRLAFWVCMGIPVAFLGAVALMPVFDISVNMISLFAFLVVLGIVVDDAIVAGENVHLHRSRGMNPTEAAIVGSREVAVSVTFGVLTTMAAFCPMLVMPGPMSKIWRVIPLIVIPTLLFSLVESKLILPAHLAHMREERRNPLGLAGLWRRVQTGADRALQWVVRRIYEPLLGAALSFRYLTLAIFGAILLLALATVHFGYIRFVYFPELEGDNAIAFLDMPEGTPASVTGEAVARLEAAALAVTGELGGRAVVRNVMASVGEQPFRKIQGRNASLTDSSSSGSHLGEVNIQLLPAEDRSVHTEAVVKHWRERTGAIPDAVALGFTSALFSTGSDIDILLSASDIALLVEAARELKEHLAAFPGVSEVADSFRGGKQEVKLRILPEAEHLGLTVRDLARQVRQGFYGEEAQRLQRGRDDVKVMVRYPAEERRSLGQLEALHIRTPAGDEVPFASVATLEFGRGFSSIRRTDRRRTINVTADVESELANANEIIATLNEGFLPALAHRYPGLLVGFEGEQRQQAETLASLMVNFALALFVIYALIAIPLGSYLEPLIILTAIPFGVVGAIGGHVLHEFDLSIVSVLGAVALAGVAVNDSLVLVEFINQFRARGGRLVDAVRSVGVARSRAIFLTSVTTFVGLLPLIYERSVQAVVLIPMAISLAYGVMFTTLVSLILVPCLYLILEDAHYALGRARSAAAAGLRRVLGSTAGEPGAPAGRAGGTERVHGE